MQRLAVGHRICRIVGLATGLLLGAIGCTAGWYGADADREVHTMLADYDQRVLGDRRTWVQHPEIGDESSQEGSGASSAEADATEGGAESAPTLLDPLAALKIAFTSSREFKDQRESLYLNALGHTLTRHDFGPILSSTISYLWRDAEAAPADDSFTANFGATQILPTGGLFSFSSALNGARAGDPEAFELRGRFSFDTSMQVSLSQPLLRGAGYEASHEPLTQGQRNLVYAVRNFELFRQNFAIRVASTYYRLVSREIRLANDEQNYQDAVFDRKKAEALRQVDRNQDDDVFLARRREIDAEDALLVSRTDYELALDDFKILLGLSTSKPIRLVNDEPPFEAVRIGLDSAVEVAHHNRLDLLNDRGRLADDERRVRLARQALRPDLDLTANYSLTGAADDFNDAEPDRWSNSVGVRLGLPVDRKAERNAYRSAQIALERARRDFQQRLDEVERDVRSSVRELGQTEKRIQLQEDQIERERRAVAVTRIRYASGDVDNRDLLDARQGLTDAQNQLIDLKVDHFIARLELIRDIGVLFINEEGMWDQ